jgi:hypothetical protein
VVVISMRIDAAKQVQLCKELAAKGRYFETSAPLLSGAEQAAFYYLQEVPKMKKRGQNNINHTQEGISHGLQPAGQVKGEQMDKKWRNERNRKWREQRKA